jgi:transposase
LVDTEGFVLKPYVTSASLSNQQGLFGILDTSIDSLPNLEKIGADQSYQGEEVQKYCSDYGIKLEVVNKKEGQGFQVCPRRCVVERTFAWLGKQRRLKIMSFV